MTDLLGPSPIDVYRGPFTEGEARRLLWRAGFGPRPGQLPAFARLGLDRAVQSLTRPAGPARLVGKSPHDDHGRPLDPINVWGQDHCWWLDRMVRSTHQLEERMTLVWHSWFATSIQASNAALMLRQNRMMRGHALGNFHDLLVDVTRDPAMLLWLSGTDNTKFSPNENYGREVMELFTLGADRGAYGQRDVHEQARALTGWTNSWSQSTGPSHFRFDRSLHDAGVKTIFGRRGTFDWRDTCRLCVQHPLPPRSWWPSYGATLSARPLPAPYCGRSSAPMLAGASRPGPCSRRSSGTRCSTWDREWSSARRLLRRSPARDRADGRDRRVVVDRRAGRAAPVRSPERGRLGLRALARHLPLVRPLHCRDLCDAGPRA